MIPLSKKGLAVFLSVKLDVRQENAAEDLLDLQKRF